MSKSSLFKVRAAAFLVDIAIISMMQLTVGIIIRALYQYFTRRYGSAPNKDIEDFLGEFTGGFFFIGYFTLSVGLFGNTVGKSFFKLQVQSETTGQPLTLKQAYWRSLGYLISSWTYFFGFILPLLRTDKKALHDLLCGTQVVPLVQSVEQSAQQLELPLLASVHQMRTPTTSGDLVPARTGTDP